MKRGQIAIVVIGALLAVIGLMTLLNELYPAQLADTTVQIQAFIAIVVATCALIAFLSRSPVAGVLRNVAIWGLIGGALIAGHSYRNEILPVARRLLGSVLPMEPTVTAPGVVALHLGREGRFQTVAEVNGERVVFLLDTGASDVALTAADARRVGIRVESLTYSVPYNTANGVAMAAPVRLATVKVGDITLSNVGASVSQDGRLQTSLLGMSFLSRLSSFEVRGDEVILRK